MTASTAAAALAPAVVPAVVVPSATTSMSVAAPVAAVAPTSVESQLYVARVIGDLEARLVAMEAELRVLRQQRDDARQALDERVDDLRRDLDDLDGRTRSAGGQATAAARNGR